MWTKEYKPVKVVELLKGCDDYDENKYTLKYMLLGTNYGKNAVTEIMAYLDDDGAEGVLTFDDKVEYRTRYRLAPPYACYRFEGNVYEFDLDGDEEADSEDADMS